MTYALARYTPCPEECKKNGANCVEFALLYLTQNELRETCVIRGILGPLPGPEKVPLLVRIARILCHSWILSVNGMKFAQFASNSLYCLQKLTKTTVEFKMNRHSSIMIIAI